MDVRRALPEDLDAVAALLGTDSLPRIPLQNWLVALDGDAIVGAVGLEVRGLRGVLCAWALAPEHRDGGLGRSLLESILSRAHELSLRDLYAMPGDDRAIFEHEGFVAAERGEVPREVVSTRPFTEAGPDAAPMRYPLATRRI